MNRSFQSAEGPTRESPGESASPGLPEGHLSPRKGSYSLPGPGAVLASVWITSVLLGFFLLRIIGSQTFQALLLRWKNQ
jgi:hypothetical protein